MKPSVRQLTGAATTPAQDPGPVLALDSPDDSGSSVFDRQGVPTQGESPSPPNPRDQLFPLQCRLGALTRMTCELQATVARNLGRLEARLLHLALVEERREARLVELEQRAAPEPRLQERERELQALRQENHRLATENQSLSAALSHYGALRYRAADKATRLIQRVPFLYPLVRGLLRGVARARGLFRSQVSTGL